MRGLAVGCGTVLVLLAACLGLTWLAAMAMPVAGAENAVLAGALTIMALVMGAALVYTGARGGLQAAHRGLARGGLWLAMGLFTLVILVGIAIIAAGPLATGLFLPPLHFLAALLPALAIVGIAAWFRADASWRATWVGLAYGGCGATAIALVIEGTLALLLVLAVLASPGAEALTAGFEQLVNDIQGGALTATDLDLAAFLTPTVVAGAFLLVGLAGPLAEELAKVLGVSLAAPRDRGSAWLWGVTIGAGFGLTEAIAFGAMAIGLPEWPVSMLVRYLATLMHATMGGLGGMGSYAIARGERRRGLGLIGLAWIGHAAWNSAVLATALGGLVATEDSAWIATLTALGFLSLVALFVLIVWIFLTLSLNAGQAGPSPASPNLGSPPAPVAAPEGIPGLGVAPTWRLPSDPESPPE